MKTNRVQKLILILSLIGIYSCSSNDDTTNNSRVSKITVANNSFNIAKASIITNSTYTNNGITEFEIVFTSSGLTVDDSGNLSGNGHFFTLTLFSNQEKEITTGDYLYNDQDSKAFVLNRGYHFFNYKSALGDNQNGGLSIESGSVSVKVLNSMYTITFNLKDENDNPVKGYFNGEISGF